MKISAQTRQAWMERRRQIIRNHAENSQDLVASDKQEQAAMILSACMALAVVVIIISQIVR